MSFAFRLVGVGWAEARVEFVGRWTGLTASYLADALGDLLEGVHMLALGVSAVTVVWAEEPGQFRWEFARIGGDVDVRIAWFDDDFFDPEPRGQGDLRITGRVSLDELVRAVAAGAREVLDLHGIDGYAEKWLDFPFPVDDLAALESYLKTVEAEQT